MKHYAGLDVSVKETSICIVDETGTISREVKVPSHPEDLVAVLKHRAWSFLRVSVSILKENSTVIDIWVNDPASDEANARPTEDETIEHRYCDEQIVHPNGQVFAPGR